MIGHFTTLCMKGLNDLKLCSWEDIECWDDKMSKSLNKHHTAKNKDLTSCTNYKNKKAVEYVRRTEGHLFRKNLAINL